jgi:acyl carrier protein
VGTRPERRISGSVLACCPIDKCKDCLAPGILLIRDAENFLFTDNQSELDDDDSFMDKEIIDSTGILEVIEFLEQETEIKVEDEDMVPDNLDSVNKIVEFVTRKSG